MIRSLRKMRSTIRVTVVTAFIVVTVLTASLAIGLQYYFGEIMARRVATDIYTSTSAGVAGELRSIGLISANVIDLLADNTALKNPEARAAQLAIFTEVLLKNPLYYGIYLGSKDGSFYEVINLDASAIARSALRAAISDRWVVITVSADADGRQRHYRYLNAELETRMSRSEPTDFDVSARPWYQNSIAAAGAHITPPYMFAQLGVPGRTMSKRLHESNTVVAIDMTLETVSAYLRQHPAAAQGEMYLFNREGQIIASSEADESPTTLPSTPALSLSRDEKAFIASQGILRISNQMDRPPIDYTILGEPHGYAVDTMKFVAAMTGLQLEFVNGYNQEEFQSLLRTGDIDLLQAVPRSVVNNTPALISRAIVSLPFAITTRDDHPPITNLAAMNGQLLAIPSNWSITAEIREHYPDIHIISASSTLDALKRVQSGEVTAALDHTVSLQYTISDYFIDNLQVHENLSAAGIALPEQLHIVLRKDQDQLRQLLDKAIGALDDSQRQYLSNHWLSAEKALAEHRSDAVPSSMLTTIAGNPELQGKLVETELNDKLYLAYADPIGDGANQLFLGVLSPRQTVIAPFLEQVKVSIFATALFLLLLIPATWIFAHPIVRPVTQLALQNDKVRRREYASVNRVDSHISELDDLSESMVSMVTAIQTHEAAQRALMDSFIELIAQAIDDKSAYTGGHCKRVPELALMLAESASASDHPAFRAFHLDSDDQWREFRIAAWLHDCGKITTPEHIVDKGSKLETIYNRIHEIRMRFEVLWRDAEIDYLKQCAKAPDQQAAYFDALQNHQTTLMEEFAFVASCNIGGEFLDTENQERIKTIAQRTWQRHFDNRIGLSPLEELRSKPAAQELPATEHLLADKPEHIIDRQQSTDYPSEFGINMAIPKDLYNLGEIYNLSISRGTLTAEDRFKINEHMISTIKMLESLPFPEELKNVPRYASTHHETMKGTGYPRRLPGNALSIPERLLAIADVFEALTAADRPYKKAKTVPDAIAILHKMVTDGHLDRDCFELFLREEIYLRYAREFLHDTALQALDLDKYLTV